MGEQMIYLLTAGNSTRYVCREQPYFSSEKSCTLNYSYFKKFPVPIRAITHHLNVKLFKNYFSTTDVLLKEEKTAILSLKTKVTDYTSTKASY